MVGAEARRAGATVVEQDHRAGDRRRLRRHDQNGTGADADAGNRFLGYSFDRRCGYFYFFIFYLKKFVKLYFK